MSQQGPLSRVIAISKRAETIVRGHAQLLPQIVAGNLPAGFQSSFNAFDELEKVISAARRSGTNNLGSLAAALVPLATALSVCGAELLGAPGWAAAAIARRAAETSDRLDVLCRFSFGRFFIVFLESTQCWFALLNALNLPAAKQGEIAPGVLVDLYAPVGLPVALLPLLLDAVGPTPSETELVRQMNNATMAALPVDSLVVAIPLVLDQIYKSSVVVSESYRHHRSYQQKLTALRSCGAFSNANYHETVLPMATQAVGVALDMDAWLSQAISLNPTMAEVRAKLRLEDACQKYIIMIGEYIATLVDSSECFEEGKGMSSPETRAERGARLMALSGFVPAYLAAMDRICVQEWKGAGDQEDLANISVSIAGVMIAFLESGVGHLLSPTMEEMLLGLAADAEVSTTVPEVVEVMMASENLERLLAAAQGLLAKGTVLGDAVLARRRSQVTGAPFLMSAVSIILSIAKKKANPQSGPVDSQFAVQALRFSVEAWNADWVSLTCPQNDLGFICCMCRAFQHALNYLSEISPDEHAALMAASEDPLGGLQDLIALQESMAHTAGSVFVTMQAHATANHGGNGCSVLEAPVQAAVVVFWAASTFRALFDRYYDTHGFDQLSAVAPALVQAVHTTLTAARVYATAAPWATWERQFSDHHDTTIDYLPVVFLNAAASCLDPLSRLMAVADGPEAPLPNAALAGLALDVLNTVDTVTHHYSHAAEPIVLTGLTRKGLSVPLGDDGPRLPGINLEDKIYRTQGAVVDMIDGRVGLEGYFTGPEPGFAALAGAIERSMTRNRPVPLPEVVGKLRRLGERAERVTEASEDAEKARVRALATLPCSCLGCTRTRRPGEQRQPAKRCSRCNAAIYCSVACQRKDWKAGHKIGCPLIAAERER